MRQRDLVGRSRLVHRNAQIRSIAIPGLQHAQEVALPLCGKSYHLSIDSGVRLARVGWLSLQRPNSGSSQLSSTRPWPCSGSQDLHTRISNELQEY
jgi:hypothetical protein